MPGHTLEHVHAKSLNVCALDIISHHCTSSYVIYTVSLANVLCSIQYTMSIFNVLSCRIIYHMHDIH